MKLNKKYVAFPFITTGILLFTFLYNLIFALFADTDPILSYEPLFYFLPLIVGSFFVYFGMKKERNLIIYLGHVVSIICSLILTAYIERWNFAFISSYPGIVLLIFLIWPLIMLLISLSLGAFYKTYNSKKIHYVVLIGNIVSVSLSVLLVLTILIVISVKLSSALFFFATLPMFFIFLVIVLVTLFPYFTRENLVVNVSPESDDFFDKLKKSAMFMKNKKEHKIKGEQPEDDVIDVELDDSNLK